MLWDRPLCLVYPAVSIAVFERMYIVFYGSLWDLSLND